METTIAAIRARLLDRRSELRHLCSATSGDRKIAEADPTRIGRLSRIEALQSQALAQDAERRRQAELKRIDSALSRIAGGEYGVCVACGEEISAKRIEMDPAVVTCIDCARKAGH
jgi:DnaK suppressor protein